MDFGGKTILITGGGTGIGAAATELLRSLGANVIILGPEKEPLEAVAAQVGAIAVVGDAAASGDVGAAVAIAQSRFGGIDGLLTCAGGGGMGRLGDFTDEAWTKALHITLNTAAVSARVCLPALAASSGSLVLVSSVGGINAPPQSAGYATAKAALRGLASSILHDYGHQLRVNVLCPGLTATAVGDMVMGGLGQHMGVTREEAYAYATRWFPARRAAQPVEIAKVAAFLLSDWSSYVNGATIIADGGAYAVSPAI